MSGHFTRPVGRSPSQTFPPASVGVASDTTLADTYVGLCDWHGRIVWISGPGERVQVGDELWKYGATRSKELMKSAVASVVTLGENRTIEVEGERGDHFRLWMWPLNDPETAVCILAKPIPKELALLTDRESACLRCLARGMSTREIADELEIGVTTVHTHLRRSREKLGLNSAEALIGFAARHFYVPPAGTDQGSATARKRSG
jgi:DNA-binding CsgD family transcriptional regulator